MVDMTRYSDDEVETGRVCRRCRVEFEPKTPVVGKWYHKGCFDAELREFSG